MSGTEIIAEARNPEGHLVLLGQAAWEVSWRR
jgi:hypothetical protein